MTPPRPTVMIAANSSWNVAHFRAPIVGALVGQGVRVVAVVPAGDPVDALHAMGVEVVSVRLDRSGTSPLRDLALLRDYRRVLREVRPAAFLGFTAKPNVYGSLAARSLGVPVINNISGLGTGFLHGGALERVMTTLYRVALARSATVFFQNGDDRDLFVARKLVTRGRARLLPGSGIDLDRFAQAPMGRGEGPARFLLVARMLRDKGVVEFVEAARMLKAKGVAAEFALLGAAGAENRSAVGRDTIDGWVREGLVDYLGEAVDVRPQLASADVVVLPSYREGMPRSLIEAAAVGRPVIASDVPGCRQAVIEGRTGLLCAARSAESLARAMQTMVDMGGAKRAAMGAANRARAEAEFGEDRIVTAYLEALAACGVPVAG